jgi:uncharacterized membrane protein YgcG
MASDTTDVAERPSTPGGTADMPDIEARGSRPLRMRMLIVGLAVVALALAGLVAARVVQGGARREALADYEQAATELAEAVESARTVATSSADMIFPLEPVKDTATTAALAEAIAIAQDLPAAPSAADYAGWREWGTAELRRGAGGLQLAIEEARAAEDAVAAALAAVTASQEDWRLDEALAHLAAARGDLDADVSEGEALMAATDGQVADDVVRQTLRDLLDQATAARDQVLADDATVADIDVTTTVLRGHVEALTAARQAVTDARSAWQAEQDRVAAENAAATAASKSSSSGSSSKGTTSSGSSGGSTGSSSGGASSSAAQDDNRSLADMLGGSAKICFDTSGNSWDC